MKSGAEWRGTMAIDPVARTSQNEGNKQTSSTNPSVARLLSPPSVLLIFLIFLIFLLTYRLVSSTARQQLTMSFGG